MAAARSEVTALAARHYDYLRFTGWQALSLDPLVTSGGQVLWPDWTGLAGYEVRAEDWHSLYPGDRAVYARAGITEDMQKDGFWRLELARWVLASGGRTGGKWHRERFGQVLAHHDPVAGIWSVVRELPGAVVDETPGADHAVRWLALWEKSPGEILPAEKAVIARMAREHALLADAAVTLKEDLAAYAAFPGELERMAAESGDPGDRACIGAITDPRTYLDEPVGRVFRGSGVPGLKDHGPARYRAMAGRQVCRAGDDDRVYSPPCEDVSWDMAGHRGHGLPVSDSFPRAALHAVERGTRLSSVAGQRQEQAGPAGQV